MYYNASDDDIRTLVRAGFRVHSPSRGLRVLHQRSTPIAFSNRKEVARVFSIGKHNARRQQLAA